MSAERIFSATGKPIAQAASAAADGCAPTLRVATWNLGWHMDRALARQWIDTCARTFKKDPGDGLWRLDDAGTMTGWQLRWGRHAPIVWDLARLPPCDVYQAHRRIVPVTPAAYDKRVTQIERRLSSAVRADVLALQEVSSEAAVREVLPGGGADYEVCTFVGYKVQRTAIAWRRAVGTRVSCETEQALSLPHRDPREQPRPGLALTLRVGDKTVRFLNVHLKSSCVSPREVSGEAERGRLDGTQADCVVLHDQVAPLEAWLTRQAQGVDALVLLGDFNRNLAHEDSWQHGVVRSPGQPTDEFTPLTRVVNLWREVNDGDPAWTRLKLLANQCEAVPAVEALCEAAKTRALDGAETSTVAGPQALGCRNPLGLDHIAVSVNVGADGGAQKVPLGRLGRTLGASGRHPDPLLGLSDHCPLVADLRLP
jgi:endonuclease/exonuclease/phosphatase family metal-dependent hydrolase